jgi:polygalacturonase
MKTMKKTLRFILLSCFFATGFCRAQTTNIYDLHTFGAVGDGVTLDTKPLQAAIDKCSAAGSGTVLVAGGKFVTGTFYLKSDVTLRVDSGAMILGSTNIADYTTDTDRTMYNEPYMNRCLIFARDAKNISIEGQGTIDGQGKSFPNPGDRQRNRPKMIRLLNCSHIRVRDITLQWPASWTSEWRCCDDLAFDNVTIMSRGISNGDGLDFDGSTNVRVTNSKFNCGDDCVCLQTSLTNKPCKDIYIADCSFSGRWAGIRIGLLSRGNFEDVTMTNCTFNDHNDSGLKIQMNEGAEMKNMVFTHLTMTNVPRPLFLTFCQKNAWVDAPWGELPPMKSVRNLQFDHITVNDESGAKNSGFVIIGMPGHPVENLSFSDIRAIFPGGGTEEDATNNVVELTPENLNNRWPEIGSLQKTVPARGLFAHHVKGITLHNVEFNTKTPDARPAVTFQDVTEIKTDELAKPVTLP